MWTELKRFCFQLNETLLPMQTEEVREICASTAPQETYRPGLVGANAVLVVSVV